jgi:hypothetical protein
MATAVPAHAAANAGTETKKAISDKSWFWAIRFLEANRLTTPSKTGPVG